MSMRPPWHLDIEGVTNFRDAGGWRTVDGRRVRSGRLFRADDPIRLTPTGRRAVDGIGLRRVVDLRQGAQVQRSQGYVSPERTSHLPLVDQVVDPDDPPPLETVRDIARLYVGMLDESRETLADVLDVLAVDAGDGPVLLHCAYGKDRAGLATALVHATLGVEREAIVADYARSHEPAQRRRVMLAEQPLPDDPPISHLPDMLFTALPEVMDSLLAELESRHGDLAGWAASFPVRASTPDRLREALLDG